MKRAQAGGRYLTADQVLRRMPGWSWWALYWWIKGTVWWAMHVNTGLYRCRICGCTDFQRCADDCLWLHKGICQKCDQAAAYWSR